MKNIQIHVVWQNRLTVAHVENNKIINNNTQYKIKFSSTHHCKPTYAPTCI